jgi:hypothetical protein
MRLVNLVIKRANWEPSLRDRPGSAVPANTKSRSKPRARTSGFQPLFDKLLNLTLSSRNSRRGAGSS